MGQSTIPRPRRLRPPAERCPGCGDELHAFEGDTYCPTCCAFGVPVPPAPHARAVTPPRCDDCAGLMAERLDGRFVCPLCPREGGRE